MEYKLIRSQRKTIAIKIIPTCEIIVLAPKKCSLNFINEFLKSKTIWIQKTIQNIQQKNHQLNKFNQLEKTILFGQEFDIIDCINHYEIANYYIKHTKASNKQKIIKKF